MRWRDGGTFEGEWSADKRSGRGTERWPDGSWMYEGEWVAGLKEGRGTYTAQAAEKNARPDFVHFGEFKADEREGAGSYTYASGADIGYFRGTEMVGEGVRFSADRMEAVRLLDGKLDERR